MTFKLPLIGLLTLLAAFTSTSNAVTLLELNPSSFGRIQDRPNLGTNGGGGTDALNNNAGNLFIGDYSNNNDVYHTAFMYDLQEQDWSFITPETTFVLRVQITGITGDGWSSVRLSHVPGYSPTTVGVSVIIGGDTVSTLNTGSLLVDAWLEFDVTSFVLSDISNNRSYSTFRFSPGTLENNGNTTSDYLRLSSAATLSAVSPIPEPANVALIAAVVAVLPILRRRKRS